MNLVSPITLVKGFWYHFRFSGGLRQAVIWVSFKIWGPKHEELK